MNTSDNPDLPNDPEERELFLLLAAYREAHLGRRPFPSVDHLGPEARRRWERLCSLTFALDQVAEEMASSSTLDSKAPSDRSVDFTTAVEMPMNGEAPPERVGRYQVRGERGRGGMGVVYEAWDPDLRRRVALKRIHPVRAAQPRWRTRFVAEAQLLARLGHPNVVQVYEVGEFHGLPFLVMEYVNGPSLRDWLNGQPLEPRQAARLVSDLARAVEHAHQHGVIHRDLKPSNVLLQSGGVDPSMAGYLLRTASAQGVFLPKVSDFGLATLRDQASGLTQTGEVLGTPGYMAPEMAAGGRDHDAPSLDVYGLGAILYEALTGHAPFVGVDPLLVLSQVRFLDPVSPRRLQPGVPRDLETICLTCLHKGPRRRYASAEELAGDLHRFLAGEPIHARRPGPVERMWIWARRNRTLAVYLAMTCFVTVVIAVLLVGTTQQAVRHAGEMEEALRATQESEARVRAREAEAVAARRRSDLLAAELKFAGADPGQ